MRPLLSSWLVIAVLTSCAPASPDVVGTEERFGAESTIQIDGAELDLDFGAPALGSTMAAVPGGITRSENCYEGDYIDCEYRDENGTLYLVYGHTLTRKRIMINGAARRGLPFGLRGDETADQAQQALNAQFGPVFTPYTVEGRSGLASVSLTNELGYEYSVELPFGSDGMLEEIRVGGIPE